MALAIRRAVRVCGFLAAGISLFGGTLLQAQTISDLSCGINQVTDNTAPGSGSQPVSIGSDGNRALVLSTANLSGFNSARNLELFLINHRGREIQQLTQVRNRTTFAGGLSASADLSAVVFKSNSNLTGENPTAIHQIFLLNTASRAVDQLTHFEEETLDGTPPPAISGNGQLVAFMSTDRDRDNDDRSPELFVLSLVGGEIEQVTDLSQASEIREFAAAGVGSRFVYHLFHPFSGFSEIRMGDLESDSGRTLISARTLALPMLRANGRRLFFVSREDFTQSNSDGSAEVFSLRTEAANPTATLRQITDFPAFASAGPFSGTTQIQSLTVTEDGQRLVFTSPVNLQGMASHSELSLYVQDVESGRLSQFPLGPGAGGADAGDSRLFVDRTGHRIAFSSRGDPSGHNGDASRETFIAECADAVLSYFPQVGDGVVADLKLRTSFVFGNTGETTSLQIQFLDQGGNPLDVDLGEAGSGSLFSFNLERGIPLLLETLAQGPLAVGYVQVASRSGLAGSAVFTGIQNSTDIFLYEAAVPLTQTLTEFSVVVTGQENFQTGLAVVNPPDQEGATASILMRLYDSEFNLTQQRTAQLQDGHHLAQFLQQLFDPETPQEGAGLLTVHSDHPLAVIALRQRDDPTLDFPQDIPTLTTFPVAPSTPEIEEEPGAGIP